MGTPHLEKGFRLRLIFFDGDLRFEASAPLTAPESPQGKGPALPERGGDQGEPPQPDAVPALARGLAGRAGNGALKKIKKLR